jgi:hypothetical protein
LLGHADPAITLRVYAVEFATGDNAERTRALLDAAIASVIEPAGKAPRANALASRACNADLAA